MGRPPTSSTSPSRVASRGATRTAGGRTVHVGGTLERSPPPKRPCTPGACPIGRSCSSVSSTSPTRTVHGHVHPVWTYAHVPHGYDGDASGGDPRASSSASPPGSRRVVGHARQRARRLERTTPTSSGGDIGTGANDPWQIAGAAAGGDRSVLDRHPWRLPVLGGHPARGRCARHVRRQRRSVGAPLAPLTVVPAALHGGARPRGL